jgi:N-acyl-D-aspartate/D-glutamate deacylase
VLDLLIKGGLLFDGTGAPGRRADIGIRAGKVVRMAPSIAEAAKETVDASGLWVTPGFVDGHTHYDVEVELAPGLSESVRHGVTTVVMGHCSLSLTFGKPQDLADIFTRVENIPRELVGRWLAAAEPADGPDAYYRRLAAKPLGPNVAALLGHSALRAAVMGLKDSLERPATDEELERMEELAAASLEAGASGISFDMVPWHMMSGAYAGRTVPSQHADFREYARLAETCRRHGACVQLTPNPQKPWTVLWALWLALGVFRPPLKLTVLAALDPAHAPFAWRLFSPLLWVMNRALGCDLRLQTLTEPFALYGDGPLSPLFEEFPSGARLNDCRTAEERRALWRDPVFRKSFRREWLHHPFRTFHRDLRLITVVRAPDPRLQGRSVAGIAGDRDAADVFMDLLETHDAQLRWLGVGANARPGPRRALLSHPHILPGFTDAGAHVRNLAYYDGPLSLLKDAVQSGFMSPERAVARCSGEPAAWLGLDRGVLAEGKAADLVLLDPARLKDPVAPPVEIEDPVLDGAMRMVKRQHPELVRAVYISGRTAALNGEPVEELGRVKMGSHLRTSFDRSRLARFEIDASGQPHPFSDYWDVFVLKHQNRWNIALHAVGVVLWYGLLAAAVIMRDWRWLLLTPSSQLVGLLGHRLFERTPVDPSDAVFTVRASACLNRMFVRLLLGRYRGDIAKAKARLLRYRAERRAAAAAAPEPEREAALV